MYHNFFIHSSVDGLVSCVHVLAIINTAAVNNGIHVSFSILVCSGYMPSFLRNLHTATMEDSMEILKKLGIKPPYDPAIPLLGIYPEETKIEKDTCPIVHCSTVYNI